MAASSPPHLDWRKSDADRALAGAANKRAAPRTAAMRSALGRERQLQLGTGACWNGQCAHGAPPPLRDARRGRPPLSRRSLPGDAGRHGGREAGPLDTAAHRRNRSGRGVDVQLVGLVPALGGRQYLLCVAPVLGREGGMKMEGRDGCDNEVMTRQRREMRKKKKPRSALPSPHANAR